MSIDGPGVVTGVQPLIPGAYERNTLTYRQPGSMSGPAFGSESASIGPSSLDAALIADREQGRWRRVESTAPQGGCAAAGGPRTRGCRPQRLSDDKGLFMASDSASRPSLNPRPAIAPALVGFATCPSCHTVDATLTNVAVSEGADWHCGRCGQRWDARRLATAAAYDVWLAGHTDSSPNPSIKARGSV